MDTRIDAVAYGNASIGRSLRKARDVAGLTVDELAARIRKTAAHVADVESGRGGATPAYVRSVLKACGLPLDWGAGE